MEPTRHSLLPQQQLAVSCYMKSMNKSQAAKDAGYSSTSVFDNASVKGAISEQMSIRAERLRIGADWVLAESVKVYNRCMQMEKVIDKNGNTTGEFKFDANNAIRALTLIGKHVDIKAFDVPNTTDEVDDDVMARLKRGRDRMNKGKPISKIEGNAIHTPDTDIDFY